MRILFMGTPDFAVASLDALVKGGCEVVAVVTAPDKPSGRGQKLNESAVKKYAVANGLPVLQPLKLKSPEFLEELRSFKADLQVVVAFRMLPDVVWTMPSKGTVNLHASILPHYRGAAPINWAVINGEKQSGVSTFFLKHEIDTGNILFSETVPIGDDQTAGELHDELMNVGARLLLKTVKAIETGDYQERPQEELPGGTSSKHAPKIFKEHCLINWHHSVQDIYNHIRGLSPHPAAFTQFQGRTLKIYKAEPELDSSASVPGNYKSDGKSYLKFECRDGYIYVLDLQIEGKKRMEIEEFLRGYRFNH